MIEELYVYVELNFVGFFNVFEGCCNNGCWYLVYVLLFFVYGVNMKLLFVFVDWIDYLISFYVVIKKVNEVMV